MTTIWAYCKYLMDTDQISKLYESLSLSNHPAPKITMTNPLRVIGKNKMELCIALKVLSTKPFKRNIKNIWDTKGNLFAESLGENRYVFQFSLKKDK